MTSIRSRNLHGAEQEVSFPRKAGGARCPAYGVSERYILRHRMHYYSSEMVLEVIRVGAGIEAPEAYAC